MTRNRDFWERLEDFVAGPAEIIAAAMLGTFVGALLGFGFAEVAKWPRLPCVLCGAIVVGSAIAVLRYFVASDEGDISSKRGTADRS